MFAVRFVRLFVIFLVLFATSNLLLASEKKLKVVTTFTVIADMARNVAGNAAEVESITKAGAEIHGYQPTPKDIRKAQSADIILWNGLNLEKWFYQFFSNLENVPSFILTDGIVPLEISEGSYSGEPNPHAWMSLDSALVYVDNIKKALSSFDPTNKATYEENARRYKNQISEVISPLRKKVLQIPRKNRWLVTCEGAFSYLVQDFQMNELYLWPINSASQGTPQQVKKVIDSVRENNIRVVFCESTVSQAPAIQVAKESGSRYGGMLYVDSLTTDDGAVPTYLELLRVTADTILRGLND